MKLYEILGIDIDADNNMIKKAYYNMAKKYHPDKNKNKGATVMFQKVNYAYTILSNMETRKRYNMMNINEDKRFFNYIMNIISKKISLNNIKQFGIILDNIVNYKSFNIDIKELFNNMNINDIFRLFNKEKITINELIKNHIDSEVDYFNENQGDYYYNLPLKYLHTNKDNIILNFKVEFKDIISKTMKKIKLKRKVDNKYIVQNFIFNLSLPHIVFRNCGDDKGHLIINLILDNNILWNKDVLLISLKISLKEYFKGLHINHNGNNFFWIPYRDGNIFKYNKYGIKFELNDISYDKIKSNII
jgi:curved DNA-binding protein CbpA